MRKIGFLAFLAFIVCAVGALSAALLGTEIFGKGSEK